MRKEHDTNGNETWLGNYTERGAYWTPLEALLPLIAHEIGDVSLGWPNPIWEPACGEGNISTSLTELGHTVVSTDIQDYGCPGYDYHDFLMTSRKRNEDDPLMDEVKPYKSVVTNPPYRKIWGWVEHAVKKIRPKPEKVAMLLPASSLGDAVKVLPGSGMSLTKVLMFGKKPIFRGPDGTADVNYGVAWFVFSKGEGQTGEVLMV